MRKNVQWSSIGHKWYKIHHDPSWSTILYHPTFFPMGSKKKSKETSIRRILHEWQPRRSTCCSSTEMFPFLPESWDVIMSHEPLHLAIQTQGKWSTWCIIRGLVGLATCNHLQSTCVLQCSRSAPGHESFHPADIQFQATDICGTVADADWVASNWLK